MLNCLGVRMRDIYTISAATIAWLELPADRSDVAFGLIGILAMRDRHSQYEAVLNTERRGYDYIWIALAQLFEREYWTRCWILQELVLARRTWFLCGSDITHLETLTSALFGAKYRHENVLEELGYPDRNKALRRTVMVKATACNSGK
jgi:hypothetical protein